jgi:hypothetical protein
MEEMTFLNKLGAEAWWGRKSSVDQKAIQAQGRSPENGKSTSRLYSCGKY